MSNEIEKKTVDGGIKKSAKRKLDITEVNLSAMTKGLGGVDIPRLYYQLVIFVLDGSGSMTWNGISGKSKGEEVNQAVKDVLGRLRNSKNKNSFDIAAWAYANESKLMLPCTELKKIQNQISFNPCDYIEKYDRTRLIETIRSAEELATEYLNKHANNQSQALVLILSDGAINDHSEVQELCVRMNSNQKITVSSIFFESAEGMTNKAILQNKMKSLASNDELYASTVNPDEIRKHMIKSISTVSKIDE